MKLFYIYFIDRDGDLRRASIVSNTNKGLKAKFEADGGCRVLRIEQSDTTITHEDILTVDTMLADHNVSEEVRLLILRALEKAFS